MGKIRRISCTPDKLSSFILSAIMTNDDLTILPLLQRRCLSDGVEIKPFMSGDVRTYLDRIAKPVADVLSPYLHFHSYDKYCRYLPCHGVVLVYKRCPSYFNRSNKPIPERLREYASIIHCVATMLTSLQMTIPG
jgi:hypothetical protein